MNQAVTEYRQSLAALELERRDLLLRDRRWNLIRTTFFLAAVVLLTLGYFLVSNTLLVVLGWSAAVAFLVAVTLHETLRDRLQAQRMRRSVLRRLLARVDRNWDRLPLWEPKLAAVGDTERTGQPVAGDPVAVADDLDVFGRGSLFQLVSMASLGPGLRQLADWLIGPAMQDTATRRHQAASLLVPLRDWRIEFYTHARRTATSTADPDHFLSWITSPSWLARHRALAIWSVASSVLISLLFVLLIVGLFSIAGGESVAESSIAEDALIADNGLTVDRVVRWVAVAIGAIFGINLLISTFMLGDVHDIFASALSGRGDVDGYRQMFALTEALPDTDGDLIRHAKATLGDPVDGAGVAMRSLGKIAMAASIKQSGGLFLIYLLLQMGGLWDLHVLRRLERWQRDNSDQAANWFAALGELEAAASLAALADENPEWASPAWASPEPIRTELPDEAAPVAAQRLLLAKQLGHPLLPADDRVCNDVSVGPQGTLLLVTGSNMSGKSTLLRSIGLNVLLAGAGGPVCATEFSLPDIELATSIRVRDNLGEGVSFYMAELKSLARVVRHAEAIDRRRLADQPRPTPTLLYLLDEILQGTNSRERQIAVAHVLRHLIDRGAIGAISTHDLELADDPVLQSIAHTVHFRETITHHPDGRDEMTFDYRMRQGVSPTTNALRLLEVVGLGNPESA